jgi:hypothetical protein
MFQNDRSCSILLFFFLFLYEGDSLVYQGHPTPFRHCVMIDDATGINHMSIPEK